MTEIEKQKITKLRKSGYGYMRIARILELSENTVKSFCRRNNIMRDLDAPVTLKGKENTCRCRYCGKKIVQTVGRKPRIFCCDNCRIAYWNTNQDKVTRKSMTETECPVCHRIFKDYPRNNRIYCSRECYIKGRYDNDQKTI